MTETLHFQWQNETLLRTIYPLREKKLRDFLVYFAELDIWAELKDKTATDLATEIKTYHQGQAKLVLDAYKDYASMRDYFLKPDVRAEYSKLFNPLDEEELKKINQLHTMFVSYLPNTLKKGGATAFVSGQENTWVQHRQEYRRLVASKKRRVDAMMPDHPKRPLEVQQLETMQKVGLGMVEAELQKLRIFVKALEKIEPRKLALIKSQEGSRWRKDAIERKLPVLQTNLQPLEASYKAAVDDLDRLQDPPDLDLSQAWFTPPDVATQVRARYRTADDLLVLKIKNLRKAMLEEFGNINKPEVKLASLKNFRAKWNTELNGLKREAATIEAGLAVTPATQPNRAEREARLKQLRGVDIPAMSEEVSRLGDFCVALEMSFKPESEVAKTIAAKQQEKAQAETKVQELKKEIAALEAELRSIDATLTVDEEKYLTEYIPTGTVTSRNIARLRVEQFENSLMGKDQQELLEEIVQRFIRNPERYPLWLQYMTIHFSGMRYKSAHGSWADPRDFLVRWHRLRTETEFGNPDDITVEKLCKEKVAQYQGGQAPRLAKATEKDWQTKRDNSLKGMSTGGPKTRRASLIALLADEVQYDFMKMSEQEALNAIIAMKDQFPGWLWKELLMLTNLKVNLVDEPDWEKLSPEEEAEKNLPVHGKLRAMVNKWREDHTAGWREEHERTHRLIVTRAVCNETAEHCQHLRGHNPPGGLTAKAPWYLKHEKEGTVPGTPRPYLTKPRKMTDFTVGASILWLRFVQEEISPWRVARPLATKGGDTLIASELVGKKKPGATDGWTYQETDMVVRKRTTVDANKQKVTQEQWLRWIHEATVAAVGETADGPVVLTYETALPDDDPGLAAIGLFKLSENYSLSDGTEENYNRSFVGFVPEGQLPTEHLEEMLDWNKILRRNVLSPAELDAWRKKHIRKQG